MILVIDIGNTTMEFGIYEKEELTGVFRLGSKRDITSDEVGLFATQFFEYKGLSIKKIESVIISSVVPQINYSVCSAVRKYFNLEPFVIGENIFCNMPNLYENPKEVGADRIVDSYAAYKKYGGPLIIVDFGTATTCEAVSAKGEYLGGIIYPGIKTSMDALYEKAAKLPKIEIIKPAFALGNNTVSSMQSGAYYGYLGAIEKMVKNLKTSVGEEAKVVATGGFARLFAEETGLFDYIDQRLPLEGIKMVFEEAKKNGEI
ncbi:MAG: type III pantothenate kinase [Oscillospiraceae bacterium]|nr:type III pantothenate kinase [Oscillospiraceae bacterium]MBR2640808.1 type III pantothenate kinase [Oscillospiraceae bacterium]MBR3952262.1 type III pantothenate kinase [Oscillospiraceae bacterium]